MTRLINFLNRNSLPLFTLDMPKKAVANPRPRDEYGRALKNDLKTPYANSHGNTLDTYDIKTRAVIPYVRQSTRPVVDATVRKLSAPVNRKIIQISVSNPPPVAQATLRHIEVGIEKILLNGPPANAKAKGVSDHTAFMSRHTNDYILKTYGIDFKGNPTGRMQYVAELWRNGAPAPAPRRRPPKVKVQGR